MTWGFWEFLGIFMAFFGVACALKELYEMIYVRRMWQQFFHDRTFRANLFTESLEDLTDRVYCRLDNKLDSLSSKITCDMAAAIIAKVPDATAVMINRLRTDPEFEKEFYTFSNSLFLNAYAVIRHKTQTEVQAQIESGNAAGIIPRSNIVFPKGHMMKPFEAEINSAADEIKRDFYEKRHKKEGGDESNRDRPGHDLAFQ